MADAWKRHNLYTNRFGAKIILLEKVRKLQLNFILDKTALKAQKKKKGKQGHKIT